MKRQPRLARRLAALIMCGIALVMMSTTATTAASAAPQAAVSTGAATKPPPAREKLSAKLLDTKVKVNAKARIQGRLDVLHPMRDGFELVVVQELRAGVWVDLQPARCQPNIRFTIRVSFSVVARYTLRVIHPTSSLSSETFVLAVLP